VRDLIPLRLITNKGPTTALAVSTAVLVLGLQTPAMGEAGSGGSPVHLGFRNHAVLRPSLTGRVSSDPPGAYSYSVLARIRIAGREVARLRFHGHATPRPVALTVPVSASKRHAIWAASRRHPDSKIVVDLSTRATLDGNPSSDAVTDPGQFLLVLP
jgi:hypothetical protein